MIVYLCIYILLQHGIDCPNMINYCNMIYIYIYIFSTSVLYIQASVFWGTCRNKGMSELCSNYVRFDVLIWEIVVYDDFLCNF